MIVTIHQPQYLPWVGYFDKIDRADVFVLLDNVQYKKNEWQNRNRIKTAQGWQWITVPVLHRHTEKITEVKINNTVDWPKKHLHALKYHYAKTPFSREFMGFLKKCFLPAGNAWWKSTSTPFNICVRRWGFRRKS